jgi:hypothetical protein
MLLIIKVIVIEVKEHLCPIRGWNPGANDTLDIRKAGEEPGGFGVRTCLGLLE